MGYTKEELIQKKNALLARREEIAQSIQRANDKLTEIDDKLKTIQNLAAALEGDPDLTPPSL